MKLYVPLCRNIVLYTIETPVMNAEKMIKYTKKIMKFKVEKASGVRSSSSIG
jgi:hypothetical protein